MTGPYRFHTSSRKPGSSYRGTARRSTYVPAKTGGGVLQIFRNLEFPGLPGPGKTLLLLTGGGVLSILLFLLFFQLYMFITSFGMAQYLKGLEPVEPNRIMDRNQVLVSELFSRKTGNLKAASIPVSLKEKLLFVEDDSFYSHGAIHWPSVIRAVFINITALGYSQGASTITQQLARILLDRREKTIFRKLKEASLAYYLEDRLEKDEILAAYMNLVYLGHGSMGFTTAARFYYDKKLTELNFTEELILVCLPSAPERYSPLKNPNLLEIKMDAVYSRMREEKLSIPDLARYKRQKAAIFSSMNRSPGSSVFGNRTDYAPFVTEYIRMRIQELFGSQYEFGAGLKIETTLDRQLQKAAVSESMRWINSVKNKYPPVKMIGGKVVNDSRTGAAYRKFFNQAVSAGLVFGYSRAGTQKMGLQTASVGINPETGEILFLQGGTEFRSGNQLNRAINMRRQTGSAIKPVVYAAGIEDGIITAAGFLDDTPLFVSESKKSENDPGYWLPDNISGVYEGRIPVREALGRSKNIPAIRLAQQIGMNRLRNQFQKFFFMSESSMGQRFRDDYTIAIGSLEMSPLEMASAFSAFGNNGVIRRPYLIKRIVDRDGNVIFNGSEKDEFGLDVPFERRVMSGDTAQVMVSLLHESMIRGGTSRGGYSGPAVGKTGTSNDNKDAWFVGVTPGLSAAVWVGYDDPAYSMRYATGSSVAGPLWGRIVSKGMTEKGSFQFSPSAVTRRICEDTGELASPNCPKTRNELFVGEHIPVEICERHSKRGSNGGQSNDWSLNSSSDFE